MLKHSQKRIFSQNTALYIFFCIAENYFCKNSANQLTLFQVIENILHTIYLYNF